MITSLNKMIMDNNSLRTINNPSISQPIKSSNQNYIFKTLKHKNQKIIF